LRFGQWLGLIALVAALVLLWSLREAVVLIFAAVVLAMALCTLVGTVRQRLGCRRPLALALSLLAVLLVATVVATAIIPPFVEEFGQLIQKLPQAADMVLKLLREGIGRASSMLYGSRDGSLAWLTRGFGDQGGNPSAIATGLGGGAVRLLGLAGNLGTGLHRHSQTIADQ
jgi:predicted PurR-regulated permease PerM